MTTIIAFMGKAGSGKDTACSILQNAAEFDATTMSFAAPAKAMCHETFRKSHGVHAEAFYGSQAEKNRSLESYGLKGWTGRKIMQHIATEGFRYIDKEVWPLLAKARVLEHEQLHAQGPTYNKQLLIAFSDARFQSESDVVHSMGGVIVRLTRNPAGDTNEGIPGHASEVEMDKVVPDYIIDNANNSLVEFKTQVINLARAIQEG